MFNLSFKTLSLCWTYFLRPFPNIRLLYGSIKPHKAYAVVTGGSKGIGIEIARLLAKLDFNLILIARNQDHLLSAKNEITEQYPGTDVLIFPMDASAAKSSQFDDLLMLIRKKPVSILINNVGVHNDIPSYVEDMSDEELKRIIAVNCTFQVEITSKLIPNLKLFANDNNKRALIMNISSLTSKMAMPLLSCYAASKAFEEHFSVGLAAELDPYHIDVLCVRPGLTVSNMSGVTTPSFFVPSAATMAQACLRMIGTDSGKINADAPYFPHAVLDIINNLVPTKWTWKIVTEMHKSKRDNKVK